MEFTEIQEINDITAYSRTFQTRQAVPNLEGAYSSQASKINNPPVNDLDYEKLLKDTPPDSPTQYMRKRLGIMVEIQDFLEEEGEIEETEQPVEQIIENLNSFLLEKKQAAGTSLPVLKKEPSVDVSAQEMAERVEEIEKEKPVVSNTEIDKREEEEEMKAGSMARVFEKADDLDVSKSYLETKSLKSFISAKIINNPQGRDNSPIKRGEMKALKVYFFSESLAVPIPINISAKVQEVIVQCLESFKSNTNLDQSLLKYPDRPEAYELKLSFQGPALEPHKELKQFKIGKELILTQVEGFDPNSPTSLGHRDSSQWDVPFNVRINILLPEEKSKQSHILSSTCFLKEIYNEVTTTKKTAIPYTAQNYHIRVHYEFDQEKRFKEAKNYLNINLPLKNLKHEMKDETIELEFVKKQFADEPTERRKQSDYLKKETVTMAADDDHHDFHLYNEVSANRYEEFEVLKITETGKRLSRRMGINGFMIDENVKKEKEGMINSMFSMFGGGNTKSDMLLTDVRNAKLLNPHTFQLEIIEEGTSKCFDFETADRKTASQIVAKVNYLKGLEGKKLL